MRPPLSSKVTNCGLKDIEKVVFLRFMWKVDAGWQPIWTAKGRNPYQPSLKVERSGTEGLGEGLEKHGEG